MSGIKIIVGVCCTYCRGAVSYDGSDNGIKAGRLDPRSYGYCLNCNRKNIFEGSFETELIEDKSEVKTEVIKSDERPSPYHILNVVRHLKYFDWYGLIDCIRATGIILDQRVEHIIKKLMVNDRGHKNYLLDLKEARWTLDLVIEKEELRLKNEID